MYIAAEVPFDPGRPPGTPAYAGPYLRIETYDVVAAVIVVDVVSFSRDSEMIVAARGMIFSDSFAELYGCSELDSLKSFSFPRLYAYLRLRERYTG